ncbi:MAG TPA: hypothetical protein VKT99_01860 [Xanthobacteraceae bacterium]|jgi:hypothetical protein|nr:hypothetical protein [Xanthobacteraceae bacterium]
MLKHAFGGAHLLGALARWAFAAVVWFIAAPGPAAPESALGAETAKIPNFAPDSLTGWQLSDDEFIPPPSGPGPIVSDPAHPYISFYRFPRNPRPSFRVADLSNPILQPWARERLRKVNERSLSGQVVAIPKERCWPVGVPAFLLLPATPVYFMQTPKEVWMIWMQNHQVRRVYLDVPHSANVSPSWYGESVGHYEGDALVVDTIGISDKSYVDNYQTPHTDLLHVIERFHMIDGGKTLEVNVHVEDPGAFTTPWNAIQHYRRTNSGPMSEVVCAENNDDHFHQGLEPMPQADKPDF